ncbi:unnamed protein product, partial [Musa acuminata var. zebrina]
MCKNTIKGATISTDVKTKRQPAAATAAAMSNKLISEMGLPVSIANVFAARNVLTAKAINTSAFLSSFTANPSSFIRFLSPWTFRVSHAATAAFFLFLRMLSRCRSSISWPFWAWISTRSGRPSRASARSPALPAERRYRSWRIVRDPHATSPPAFVASMTHCAEEFRLALSRSWLVHQESAKPRENERSTTVQKQHSWRWPLSFLKSLAEFSQIPIVVTNQVRSQNNDEVFHYSFQAQKNDTGKTSERLESHLTAALGIQWAHAVTIRLIFEAHSGQRFIKVSKSPTSPAVAFPFVVESSGISLLSHDGLEVMGAEICTIHCQGSH